MHSIFCHHCLSFWRIMKCSTLQAQNIVRCIAILGVITFSNRRQTRAFAPSSNRILLAFVSPYSACTAKGHFAKFKHGCFTEIRDTSCIQKQVQSRKLQKESKTRMENSKKIKFNTAVDPNFKSSVWLVLETTFALLALLQGKFSLQNTIKERLEFILK